MKNLKLTNILPIALGFALGYVAYKMVAKMIGDQDEVEPMLSARGSFSKRPGVMKSTTGSLGPCRVACQGGDCSKPCTDNGGHIVAGGTYGMCEYPAGHPTCKKRSPYIIR